MVKTTWRNSSLIMAALAFPSRIIALILQSYLEALRM